MRLLNNKIMLTFIVFLLFLNSVPYSYAFFDNTSTSKNLLLQTGTWTFNTGLKTYFTSFEEFENTEPCYVTKNIDGELWHLCNVVSAELETDKKFGNKSVRISNCGFLASNTYFTGLELISFFIGLAHNSDDRGLRKFSVSVSAGADIWTNILTDKTNICEFRLVSIDIKSLLVSGLSLEDGTIAYQNTPLRVKISFNGVAPIGSARLFNLDDLTIKYVSK